MAKKKNKIEVLPNGKKALTAAVMNSDFKGQKNPLWSYLLALVWFAAIVAFSYYFNPVCYLCCIPMPFMLIKEIKKDIRRRKLKYYSIERPCIEKKLYERDEDPDEWQLWFNNREGDWNVAATVDKEYYDATEVGDEFYLVFAENERTPCLWYRKSEWEYVN